MNHLTIEDEITTLFWNAGHLSSSVTVPHPRNKETYTWNVWA